MHDTFGIRDGIPMDVGGRKACSHLSLVEVMLDTKAARREAKLWRLRKGSLFERALKRSRLDGTSI